jgi:hypothetical protein
MDFKTRMGIVNVIGLNKIGNYEMEVASAFANRSDALLLAKQYYLYSI